MRQINIHFPRKLIFGKDSLDNLADEVLCLQSSKVLIVTIPALLPKLRSLVDRLKSQEVEILVDTSIVQEPGFDHLDQLLGQAALFDPDLVLGVGGGSVLDIAKLIAAFSGNTQQAKDCVGAGLLQSRPKRLICVPATSGTGSEVSPNAILVDPADDQKKGIISPFLVPDIVVADPLLTCSVPPAVTAATGLDALTHCLEAYTNKFSHPLIDIYAVEGIRLIAAHLLRAVKDGNDEEARTQLAVGSMMGGFCLGPVNTAAVHALAYPLGTRFHLPHGLSNAILLPWVMEFNIPAAPRRYAEVALFLGCAQGKDDVATACRGVELVRALIRDCSIPGNLRESGIPENAIPGLAEEAMKITRLLKNNPRPVTIEDAEAIYTAAY